MRLDKLLVERGVGTRREVTRRIAAGGVSRAGVVLDDPGADLPEDAVLDVDGEPCGPLPPLLAWHKPAGVLSTVRDPWGREGLDSVLPAAWDGLYHPVGRLDADTSGLLLFARDGALTQWLLHPRRAIPRTYVATVEVDPPDDLAALLAAGVETGEGVFTADVRGVSGREVTLTVVEGKHRMVRRMLHNAGASVAELRRVAYGPVELGELGVGEIRPVWEDPRVAR